MTQAGSSYLRSALPAAASGENRLMGSYRAEMTAIACVNALDKAASRAAVLVLGVEEDSPCLPCWILLPSAVQLHQRRSGLLALLANLDMVHIRQVPELMLPALEKWHTLLHGQEPLVLLGDPANVASVEEVVGGGGLGLEP